MIFCSRVCGLSDGVMVRLGGGGGVTLFEVMQTERTVNEVNSLFPLPLRGGRGDKSRLFLRPAGHGEAALGFTEARRGDAGAAGAFDRRARRGLLDPFAARL